MKTLKELGLQDHWTANYADRSINDGKEDLCCCGWMEIHEDSLNLGPKNDPIFRVSPVYWAANGVFVLNVSGDKWVKMTRGDFLRRKKKEGIKYFKNGFSFDARLLHGFMPKKIASTLKKGFRKTKQYNDFVANRCDIDQHPKLVWSFK